MPEHTTHILQAKVDKAAHELAKLVEGRCHVTLVAFYNGVSVGGVGFSTNLDLDSLILTVEARIARWCNAPLPAGDTFSWVPGVEQLAALGELCRQELPFSAAFALICGAGVDQVIAGSVTPLSDLLPFFSDVLLPQLKARQAVSPQPEAP